MLDIKNVSVRFGPKGTPFAIEDVSLSVQNKHKSFLIGETGSGKSVLLLAILKILPATAFIEGSAVVDGRDIMALSEKDARKVRGLEISYVPQGSGYGLNPLLKIAYQVGEPLIIHKKYKKKAAIDMAKKLLARFDLGDTERVAASYPHELSGGMKQRALIAMGVAADAEILFLDEPTKGLDEARIEIVKESFRELKDKTIVCVTHDLRFAKDMADDISVMYASQKIEEAPAELFFSNPLHPYSQAIIRALPENGLQISKGFAPPRVNQEKDRCCHYKERCPFCTERCNEMPPMVELDNRKVRCWKYVV